jgi:hypothetical protein
MITAKILSKGLCTSCSAKYFKVEMETNIQKALDEYDALFIKLEAHEDGIRGICQ